MTDATSTAAKILEAFEHPDELPEKLANVVLANTGRHCDRYSWGNQFLVWIAGYSDAAGYKQWLNEYGRQVRKGEKSFAILAPITQSFWATDEETGEKVKRTYIKGWRDVRVFGLEQTDVADAAKWEARNAAAEHNRTVVESAPLYTVATEHYGLHVAANGSLAEAGAAGCYISGLDFIQLGVENLATFAHELIHAVDDRLGNLTKRHGQQPDNEIVAELGGAILLTCMGLDHDADLGGCWQYIKSYGGTDPLRAANTLLNRTLDAVHDVLQALDDE
jgi:hypothetical protein